MSEVFEGLICNNPIEEIRREIRRKDLELQLIIEEFVDSSSIVYRNDTRADARFTTELDNLAVSLSILSGGDALLVRYDSRIGYRASILYVNGNPIESFDESKELFVLLDETGEPLLNSQLYTLDQLQPDEEYETGLNAIELGLQRFGKGDWNHIKKVIGR